MRFFHVLFSVKIRVEIRFNNVLDRKQTFFDYKDKIFQSPKNCIFPEGLLVKKCNFFLYFFSVKIRLEIMLNEVWDRKQCFFLLLRQNFSKSQKSFFPKGLTHAFGQKFNFFLYLLSVKKGLEIRFNDVLDRKERFSTRKTKYFNVSKIAFSKGVNPCFWSKTAIFFIISSCSK